MPRTKTILQVAIMRATGGLRTGGGHAGRRDILAIGSGEARGTPQGRGEEEI